MARLLRTQTGKTKCCSLHTVAFLLIILVLVLLGWNVSPVLWGQWLRAPPKPLQLRQGALASPSGSPSPAFHGDGWRALPGPPSSTVTFSTSFPSTGFPSLRSVMQGIRKAGAELLYPQPKVLTPSRNDVLVLTPWLAPIVWEGTFNTDILNEQFRLRNTTIGLTVFAIRKYVVFLELFLQTAEKHFMVGHRVTYYVFTDRPAAVPRIPLGEGRRVVVLEVLGGPRWQDVSMQRMAVISRFCEQRFLREVDYLVCADVDMKFRDHVGVEILSPLFGTLHPSFYGAARKDFTYERRPRSQAHIPRDQGDFYYMGALFGGSVAEVHRLTSACHQAMAIDQANGIEAVWHDESHLNRYLLDHKPTKVLSPEYLWDQQLLGWPQVMKKLRFVAVPKNHQDIRAT